MNKKAQGLSINVIIIVAISLIVLVVLVAVFTGNLGGFTKTVGSTTGDSTKICAQQTPTAGSLKLQSDCTGRIVTSSDSGTDGKICCIG